MRRFAGYAVTVLVAAWSAYLIHSAYLDEYGCEGHKCGLWQDVVRKSPGKPRGYINLGEAYRKKGILPAAIELYQQAQTVSLQDGRSAHERETTELLATTDIATVLMAQGQRENAHQVLKAAWLNHPGFPGFAVPLSSFYIQNGEPLKAVAVLNEAIDRGMREYPWFNRDGLLYLHRGIAWHMLKQCDLAMENWAEASKRPEDIPAMPPCP